MNGTLNEHLEIKNPSTGDARDMLHIGDQSSEITRYDLNYAGNTYLVALHELAALRSEIANYETARQEDVKRLEHRFVTCTWCGWRLDYEADGREAAYATANEHALSCKADPRTAQLATVTAERGELFNVAVKAFQAVEQMDLKGELSKYSAMQNLDYVCARISKKLWERVDAAALKGGKG